LGLWSIPDGSGETFGLEREAELRKFLELEHGIPDESTFSRVFQRVKPDYMFDVLFGK